MDFKIIALDFLLILLCVLAIDCRVVVVEENDKCANETDCNNFAKKELFFDLEEPRKKEEDLMTKILPMMVMPFMVQTTLLPMMLMSMKFMLMKSAFLGKMAIFLGAVTLLRNYLKQQQGGLYSHNINIQSQSHHRDLSSQNYNMQQGGKLNSKRKKKRRR